MKLKHRLQQSKIVQKAFGLGRKIADNEKFQKAKQVVLHVIAKLPKKKPHTEKYYKRIAFLNKYSLVFHFLLSCFLTFMIEVISRRSFISACSFVGGHTLAYLYNAFIIFASLTLVYLVRRRALLRLLISGFWIFLGTVNGVILSNRVTPFTYTDLKCISDLFAMQNTNYFTAEEATAVVAVVGAFFAFCVFLFFRGPKYQGKKHNIVSPICIALLLMIGLPVTTQAAQNSNILASYFSNIAQGFSDYGFIYGFSSSVVGRGMDKPDNYTEENVAKIEDTVNSESATTTTGDHQPNIITVLLESFVDPSEVKFLETSEDPIPTFHYLEDNFSTGYLTVPVVGAGTANTEFEVLTGMSVQYFGTGEYPYKTILKQTDCESIASDLTKIGYATHVTHNNTATFYSRNNAFSMMGFNTFTSKELLNITELTPNGNWSTDDVLVGATVDAMDSTVDQSDFVYTITVEGHGDYPKEKILENPTIRVTGAATEESNNQWEYYVNMIHNVDDFMNQLITAVNNRGEDTIIVFFGDHLPTMGLEDSDMKSGDIYKTKYVTWNNFGLEKQDADLYAYQLLAHTTDQLGIHEGTMFKYHQTQSSANPVSYQNGLEMLQYDLLYGNRYAYGGKDLYPATELQMGIKDISIKALHKNTTNNTLTVYGNNFTKYSKVFVNGEKVPTNFISTGMLTVNLNKVTDGDTIMVNIVGAQGAIFRSSNEYTYVDPAVIHDTEDSEMELDPAQNGMLLTNPDGTTNNQTSDDVINPSAGSESTDGTSDENTTLDDGSDETSLSGVTTGSTTSSNENAAQ